MGVLTGTPMVPDEIRELLNQMNQPKLAHVLPADEDDNGSGNDVPAEGVAIHGKTHANSIAWSFDIALNDAERREPMAAD